MNHNKALFLVVALALTVLTNTYASEKSTSLRGSILSINTEEQCPFDMAAPGAPEAADTTRILSLGSRSGIDYFKAPDGSILRYVHFSPAGTPKGAILFMQGRGTFIEYYYEPIKKLLDRGFEVWMFDLAGQGGSTRFHEKKPLHQHIDTFDTYINHAHEFINKKIVPTLGNLPLLLMGYSTGGNIVLRYLEEYPNDTAGGVLISPLTGINPHLPLNITSQTLLKSFLKGLTIAKGKQAGGHDIVLDPESKNNLYTSDPAGFEEIKILCDQNPNLTVGGATYGWLEAALNSAAMLKKPAKLKAIIKPVLFVSAGADQIVLPAQDAPICKQIKECTHKLLQGARHEILREQPAIRDAFWNAFDSFITEKVVSPS